MAITANQKVLTLDYWKPASKIEVGDYVIDKNGNPVRVKLVQQYRSEQCYEVVLNDHLSVAGDVQMGFLLETEKYRNRLKDYKGIKKFRRPLKFTKLGDMLNMPLTQKRDGRSSLSIPTTQPLNLPHQDLPVPPFLFGFWFLNHKPKGHMVFPKGQQKHITEKFKEYGYKVIVGERHPNGERQFIVDPPISSQLTPPNPAKIPNNYLLASSEQRLQLLSGLINAKSRQYSDQKDRFRITHPYYPAFLGIVGLIESLGNHTSCMEQKPGSYTVFFKTRLRLVENQVSPPIKVHLGRRFIKKIIPIAPQSCVHIETDGVDKSFLVGEGFISCL